MAEYDNTNRGVLFKNDKKGNDKAPDYKGKLDVNGAEFELAAWIKVSGKGNKFMSISIKPPYKKDDAPPVTQQPAKPIGGSFDDMADDIPF